MYLALFLMPWIAMYAASTMVMNHRRPLSGHGAPSPEFERVEERDYPMSWAPGAGPERMAEQILRDLGLEGRYSIQAAPGKKLTILRNAPVAVYRITYYYSANSCLHRIV